MVCPWLSQLGQVAGATGARSETGRVEQQAHRIGLASRARRGSARDREQLVRRRAVTGRRGRASSAFRGRLSLSSCRAYWPVKVHATVDGG